MSTGSVLVALALAVVVGAYLLRPFRRQAGPDRAIEAWVARVRAGYPVEAPAAVPEEAEVNFCPRCGRRVGPEDRFCARCGAPLRGGGQ